MSIEKIALRTQLKTARETINATVIAQASQSIIDQLLKAIDWSAVHSVHTYLPRTGKNEVDTNLLVTALNKAYPHVTIATWVNDDSFVSTWLGTSTMRTTIAPDYQFDVIIVPLLGFNDKGFRIGFGGGFYDRFLSAQLKAFTAGVGYESGRVNFTPEPHDIALKAIITEKQTLILKR